jgi:hypothetical protein
MISCPGKPAPKIHSARWVPTTGIDIATPWTTSRLPPDIESSGRIAPDSPATMPRISMVTQMSQFSQRGRRNAPVK